MAEKIGVYFDKSSIGPYLDLDGLTEFVQNKFGGFCPVVKVHNLLPSEDGRATIKADLDAEVIDSVLICGASPRVDWDFFDFGDSVLVERVNLREHCVLAFQAPDGTTAKAGPPHKLLDAMAKDYVAMGVVKLQKSEKPEAEIIESVKKVLVLGGGWAGLTAALDTAKVGMDVVLVEKTGALGGKAAGMLKTVPLRHPYTSAHETGIEEKIEAVNADSRITVKLNATLDELAGAPGNFTAKVNGEEIAVGAVVLATGWVEQDASVLAPLGYGSIKDVVTTWQFEEMAKKGEIVCPSDGRPAKKVAFVLNTKLAEPEDIYAKQLCEDPKDDKKDDEEEQGYVHQDMEAFQHLNYATSVNTMVALKQANYVTEQFGDGMAYIFYDSMIVPGIQERYYKVAQDATGVMLTKADITGIEGNGSGVVVKAANTLFGPEIEVAADLVVVPTGMVPTTAKDPIMNFKYRQGPNFPDLDLFDGFADSNYICFPYETRRTGVYAAGAVRQPMLMDAATEDATGAALKAIQCIESSNRGMSVHPRSGDLTFPRFNFVRCTQCKRCTEECPFGALDDDEKGTPMPNPTRCRRCGTCMGACPERVIFFDNYNIDQIGSMIREINVPDDMDADGPRVLILACENDAYPALDMAAMRGKHWSPYVRIIPVRCLGSVNAIWVADAMSKGIDGVMMLGCKYGDDYQCHFVKGSEICNRRKENIAETLDRLGVEPDRVEQYEIAIDEYDKVPGLIDEFMDMIVEKGPNPFKGY